MILVLGGTGGIGSRLALVLDALSTKRPILDLADEASIAQFFSRENWHRQTDALHVVNATGVSHSAMLHKAELADIERTLRVNLTGNLLLLKYLRPLFKGMAGSTLTMLSSVTPDLGTPGTAAYSASKAALRGLVRVAAQELAVVGGRTNVIELGFVDTGMIRQIQDLDSVVQSIPLKRLCTVDELACAVRFCQACTYLTGSVIKLNGGLA